MNVGATQASNLQGRPVSVAPVVKNEVVMNDQTKQQQTDGDQAQSADPAVDQKNKHTDNDNDFSPGFKPQPDRAKPGEETDADIDTDGG
nr:hypothetical protein [Pseudomonas sp. MG-9]